MKPLRNDDPIWHYPARWIEASGSELPVAFRYDTWKCLAVTFPLWLIVMAQVPGLGRLDAWLAAGFLAIMSTMAVIKEVDGDRSLIGVVEIYGGEARSRARRDPKETPTRVRVKARVRP